MNIRKLGFLTGVAVCGALVGLGIHTMVQSHAVVGNEPSMVNILSDEVSDIRPGDPVLLDGVTSGRVLSVEQLSAAEQGQVFGTTESNPPRTGELGERILAQMELDPFTVLREDFQIRIGDRGLLGGKLIRIDSGSAQTGVDLNTELVALRR